jgi:gliding motility-associated-like protein
VQLQVLPNNVGQWIPSSYLSSSGAFNPANAAIGNNAIQYMIGTSTCNTQQTNFVSVENFVPATVLQPLVDLCTSNPAVNLAPFTANANGNWTGPGITGNNFSPTSAGAGSFKLIYKTSSTPSGLCPDVDTLSVKVYSLDAPYINPAGPICNNAQPFQIKVSPLGGLFKGMNSNALSSSGLFNPAAGVIGKNVMSYSISSGPCIAFAQATITVEEFVSAAIIRQPDFAYCANHEAFNLNGFVKNQGGTWNGPGLVGANMFDPSKANLDDNNVLYYHTQSSSNALLCPDVSSLTIRVKSEPKATIQTTSLTGCAPLNVVFTSPEHTTGKGLWSFDDGTKRNGFNTAYTFTHSGTFNVVYNYEDLDAPGCSTQVRLISPVKVLAQPYANFEVPDEITMSDPQVKLLNTSSPLADNQYLWTIQGMEQYFEVHPIVIFPQKGTYRVTLQATDINGCKAERVKFVEVKNDFNVFVPNSFTPNYDGLNDVFKPVFSPFGLDSEAYEFIIYDRWGQVVFTTRDISTGWDGSFMNKGNQLLKQDTYTYQLKYRDYDGQVFRRTGLVQLLK